MKKKIGSKVRLLRLEKGYTQINLAEAVKISESTYRSIEAGTTILDVTLLYNITKELDIDFFDFIASLRN